jgi:hypothetical protein
MGLVLCAAGFAAGFLFGRLSVVAGLGAVLTAGYLYGILRANYLDSFTHFIFDAAVVGFYLSVWGRVSPQAANPRAEPLRWWVTVLLAWVAVMFLLPMQHLLIQLVGLRGNAFLVPFLLVGTRLTDRDRRRLCLVLAVLNVMALGFAVGEYALGVPAFFPENAVTEIIYKSNDVADHTAFRIPACFVNAHAFAGTMVGTIPWLVGAWMQPRQRPWQRYLVLAGLAAALVGVFMAGARVHLVLLFVLVAVVTLSGQLRGGYWLGWLLLLGGVGYLVSGEERLQRFLTLAKTQEVMERIEGSVNMNFWELFTLYPMGNGLGGGGTSVPFFLRHLIRDPVVMENEYSRILLEQGLVGLALWVAFFAWALTRPAPPPGDSWRMCWRLLWWTCLGNFAASLLGTGLMTAIPQTALIFLSVGFLCVPRPMPARRRPARGAGAAAPKRKAPRYAVAVS